MQNDSREAFEKMANEAVESLAFLVRELMERGSERHRHRRVIIEAENTVKEFINEAVTSRVQPPADKDVETLQRFKDYVHKRLDDAGIPTHPEGEHSAHGCRIGDRLDIALLGNAPDKDVVEAVAEAVETELRGYYATGMVDEDENPLQLVDALSVGGDGTVDKGLEVIREISHVAAEAAIAAMPHHSAEVSNIGFTCERTGERYSFGDEVALAAAFLKAKEDIEQAEGEGIKRGLERAANELENGFVVLDIVLNESNRDLSSRLLTAFARKIRAMIEKEETK